MRMGKRIKARNSKKKFRWKKRRIIGTSRSKGAIPEDAALNSLQTTEGIGLFGESPLAVQPLGISDAEGGFVIDVESRNAINEVLALLRSMGAIES